MSKRTNKSGDSSDTGAGAAAATAAGILPPQDQRKYYGNYGKYLLFTNENRKKLDELEEKKAFGG